MEAKKRTAAQRSAGIAKASNSCARVVVYCAMRTLKEAMTATMATDDKTAVRKDRAAKTFGGCISASSPA
jgi:hypothetical protein